MKKVIKNTKIMLPDFEFKVGDIYIEDDKIFDIEYGHSSINGDFEVIDGTKTIAIPTFKNCHSHSAMTLLRARAEDMSLMDWLFKRVFPFEEKLTADDVYWGTQAAILEYAANGIGAIADMYYYPEAIKAACEDSGFRAVLVHSAGDTIGERTDLATTAKALEKIEQNLQIKQSKLVSNALGLHAEYTASNELIKGISRLAQATKAPVFTHLCETRIEVETCLKRHNMSPTERLIKNGFFEFGGGVYHCVHPTSRDLELIFDKKLTVISCPASNLKLASGIAPIAKFLRLGISVALGTDGPASNNALDMFRELYLLATLGKVTTSEADFMPLKLALSIAFNNSARIFGSNGVSLKKGQNADIVLLDENAPSFQPSQNIAASLVYSANPRNVVLTMVAGKVLYEKGKFNLRHPAHKIYSECNKAIERINKSL